jgi:hypothetical protein
MNESQTVFTVLFAISWGNISNVLPRWKPFHEALVWKIREVTWRFIVAVIFMNLVPWIFLAWVLFLLQGPGLTQGEWTVSNALRLILSAMVPGLIPFGCYRFWLAINQKFSSSFYLPTRKELGARLRTIMEQDKALKLDKQWWGKFDEGSMCNSDLDDLEPSLESLNVHLTGAFENSLIGVAYIFIPILFAWMFHRQV